MELKPIARTSEPRYPTYSHHQIARRWLRRAAAAGAASVALWLGGCTGCGQPPRTAGEPPPITQPDPDTTRPGGVPPRPTYPDNPPPPDVTPPDKPPSTPPVEPRLGGAIAPPLPPSQKPPEG